MNIRQHLLQGHVIPAHPLVLNAARKFDERRQRALTRYYLDAGAGGIAVGVHTTQFAIREPRFGLFRPVLELAIQEMQQRPVAKIAGVCGLTPQAARRSGARGILGLRRSSAQPGRATRCISPPVDPTRADCGKSDSDNRFLPATECRWTAAAIRLLARIRGD